MQKRCIVKEFLADMFQYNPDKHVRSSYCPDPDNPARNILETDAAKLATQNEMKRDKKLREKMRIHKTKTRLLNASDTNPVKVKKKKGAKKRSKSSKKKRKEKKQEEKKQEEKKQEEKRQEQQPGKDETLIKTVSNMIPAADFFHRFRYYYDVNYEELRDVVKDLTHHDPLFEISFNPYEIHDNVEEADIFISKHKMKCPRKFLRHILGGGICSDHLKR